MGWLSHKLSEILLILEHLPANRASNDGSTMYETHKQMLIQ